MSHRTRALLVLTAFALAVAVPATAEAETLTGTVGPGFTISLTRSDGSRVQQLDPGVYTIVVHDRSEIHNFHLFGLGVDERTGVEFVGTVTWTVTFVNGQVYRYRCDPHGDSYGLKGSFTVGLLPGTQPPPAKKLFGTVGPGFTISLKNAAGSRVRTVRAGTYVIVVRDRSRIHNFHLFGLGVNRKTGVAFTGTVTWKVKLVAGQVYRYRCDPHRASLKGSFRVAATPATYGRA